MAFFENVEIESINNLGIFFSFFSFNIFNNNLFNDIQIKSNLTDNGIFFSFSELFSDFGITLISFQTVSHFFLNIYLSRGILFSDI